MRIEVARNSFLTADDDGEAISSSEFVRGGIAEQMVEFKTSESKFFLLHPGAQNHRCKID
jgi:hypothetical protein